MSKILIIDDDPDIVEAMKIVLESRGHQVRLANTGDKGLQEARRDKPELVILDVMMETTDKGFDVAREIKGDPQLKDIPIIMLTALKDRTGIDFSQEAGDDNWLPVDDFCDKPLHPDKLLSKVEALLKKA